MKVMKKFFMTTFSLLIIFGIYYISLFVVNFFKIPFPAPILGIFILFLLLQFEVIPENLIEKGANLFLKYMILFFIPLFVGIVNHYKLISQNLLPILLSVFISGFLGIILIGLFVEYMIKYTRLHKIKKLRASK